MVRNIYVEGVVKLFEVLVVVLLQILAAVCLCRRRRMVKKTVKVRTRVAMWIQTRLVAHRTLKRGTVSRRGQGVVQEWDRQQQVQAQRRKRKRRRMTIHRDLGIWGAPRRVERKMNPTVRVIVCRGILVTDFIEHIPS